MMQSTTSTRGDNFSVIIRLGLLLCRRWWWWLDWMDGGRRRMDLRSIKRVNFCPIFWMTCVALKSLWTTWWRNVTLTSSAFKIRWLWWPLNFRAEELSSWSHLECVCITFTPNLIAIMYVQRLCPCQTTESDQNIIHPSITWHSYIWVLLSEL